MTQPELFEDGGRPTPSAKAADPSAECSRDAKAKVDVLLLRTAVKTMFFVNREGLTSDEVTEKIQSWMTDVDEFSIRPRVSELKRSGFLVVTGTRRKNKKGNSCAVLIHRDHKRKL